MDIATAGPAALGSAAPEADAEDVDVDMDIDPMAGAHALSARLAHADRPFRALLVVQKLNTCSISPMLKRAADGIMHVLHRASSTGRRRRRSGCTAA